MSSVGVSDLPSLKKALIAASTSKNSESITEILQKLLKITVTKDILKSTGVGQAVGKLRQFENKDIAQLAKDVVNKWKKDVTSGARGTPSTQSGQSTPKPKSSAAVASTPASSKSQTPSSLPNQSLTAKNGVQTPTARTSASTPVGANTPAKKAEPSRTAASDNVSFSSLGDNVRQKCCEMLYNSLVIGSTSEPSAISSSAQEIEKIEYQKEGNTVSSGYKSRIRSLCLSLRNKDNPSLRVSIVSGAISAEKFCSMSPEEMASEERKKLDAKIKEENLFKAKGATNTEAETDQFRCGRCGKRKCTYYQMQTRSADEPMTTFVTCINCNNRWKFC